MNRTWKLGMDSLLFLFYANLAILIYTAVTPNFHPLSLDLTDHDQFQTQNEHIDPVIKRYARLYGMDWRFIYAMIQVESRFEENAVSHAGAVGLMQVMPRVALDYNVDISNQPDENIKVGVRHFNRYLTSLTGNTMHDKVSMALAAYNGGIGHIYDAKILAQQRGLDPRSWAAIAQVLPEMENAEVFENMRHGYCQGKNIVRYVNEIQRTYQVFKDTYPFHPLIPDLIDARAVTALSSGLPSKG